MPWGEGGIDQSEKLAPNVSCDAVTPWWIEPDDVVLFPPSPPLWRCSSCHLWFVGEGGGVAAPLERLLIRALGVVEQGLI